MVQAAIDALAQMLSPPLRAILLKSMGLAVVVLAVLAIAVFNLVAWLAGAGGVWVEGTLGPAAQTPVAILSWILAIVAGLGLVAGAIFLVPAATALVAGVFGDEIASHVERMSYPAEPPGIDVPIARALAEGIKFALLTILVYLCAVPFLLVAGLGAVIFFLATAYLLSRQYFELAAMRFHPAAEAKALRRRHRGTLFAAGLIIAAFVSIPIVNLATPIFATAFMVHMHKRLTNDRHSGSRAAAVRNP